MDFWKTLELAPTADVREIKRAYARLTKKYHPEDAPEEFRALHDAYEQALAYAKRRPVPLAPNPQNANSSKAAAQASPTADEQTRALFDFSTADTQTSPPGPAQSPAAQIPPTADEQTRALFDFSTADAQTPPPGPAQSPAAQTPPTTGEQPRVPFDFSTADAQTPPPGSAHPPAARSVPSFDFSQTEEKEVYRQASREVGFIPGFTPKPPKAQLSSPSESAPNTYLSALMREQERRVRIARLLVQFDLLYLDPKRRAHTSKWQKLISGAETQALIADALFFPCLAEFLDARRDLPRRIWLLFDQLIPIQQLAILKDRGVYSSIYRVLDSRFGSIRRRGQIQAALLKIFLILIAGVLGGFFNSAYFFLSLTAASIVFIRLAGFIFLDMERERRSAQRGPVPRTPAMMKCRLGIRVAAISYLAVLALSASGLPQALFSPAVGSAVFSVLVALLFAAFASLAALWITLYIREWRRISAAARKEP